MFVSNLFSVFRYARRHQNALLIMFNIQIRKIDGVRINHPLPQVSFSSILNSL